MLLQSGVTLLPPLGSLKPASLTVCLKWVSNQGTAKLASFLHALGDHAYWVIKGMIGDTPKSAHTSVHGVSDIKAEFDHELSISRHNREGRITAEDIVMDLLE